MAVLCPDCHSENTEDSQFCKTCGTSIRGENNLAAMTQTIVLSQEQPDGERLMADRYRVLSTLGRGGMGDVFRVRDIKLQEEMALKVLRPEIASDPDIILRFRNELKLARKITHRNVCRVFDFHEEGGTPFITMEYVEGENLKSLIKRKGRIEEAEALGIAVQIAEGLVEAHALGVVHRDLKPQNVMIEPSARAKIMDFGIARSLDASGLTQTGQMIGTPDYLSSEQAAGQPADHRADIYALGVILFEMATGSLPFKGDTALSVITKHREAAARDPREINPEISEGLSRIILRCMEKDPELRYQSVRDLVADLQRLSKGEALPKVRDRGRSGVTAIWRKLGPAAAAVLVVIAVVVVVRQVQNRGPSPVAREERPSLAVLYFENNTGDESLDHWRKAFADLLTTDLSQSKYLYVLPGDVLYKVLDDLGQLEARGFSSDILKKVSREGGVRHILRGSYTKAGPRFRVSISLQDMESGEVVGSQTAEAESEENLFALVDELTPRIKSDLNLTSDQIAGDFDKEAADVTTSSPEAYRLYLEGLRHNYRSNYLLCLEYMDKAIALDPEFASAYVWKAYTYNNLGYHAEFLEAINEAFKLRDKITERERYRFSAFYYLLAVQDVPKAFEELEKFVTLYPEDIFANHQMGFLHFHAFEDYDKARFYLNRAIDLGTSMFYSYYVLAWIEMCLGDYAKAQEACELYLDRHGEHPEMRFKLAVKDFCLGDYDRALAEVRIAAESGFAEAYWNDLLQGSIMQGKGDWAAAENHYRSMLGFSNLVSGVVARELLGNLALLRGRYAEAGDEVRRGIALMEANESLEAMSRMSSHLAYIHLQRGAYDNSLEESEKALEFADKAQDFFYAKRLAFQLKGLAQLAMRDPAAALKTAEALKAFSEQGGYDKALRDYLHLLGSIKMQEEDFDQAVQHLEEAVSMLPQQNQDDIMGFNFSLRRTIYLASLAEAYFRNGDLDLALKSYENLASLTIGRHHWGDLWAKSFYWLGRISEEQDKSDEAADHYRKFLELWENADPGLPEVADARERATILQ